MDLKGLGYEDTLKMTQQRNQNFFELIINFRFKRKCEVSWGRVLASQEVLLSETNSLTSESQ